MIRLSGSVLLFFFLLQLGLATLSCSCLAQEKSKVPTDSEAEESENLAREVYGERYRNARTRQAKSELSREILDGAQSEKDKIRRYVMLRLAKNIAVNAADIELALEATDAITNEYQVEGFQQQLETLAGICKNAQVSSLNDLVEMAEELAEQAIREDEHAAFLKFVDSLGKLAAKSREPELRKLVSEMKEGMELLAEVFKEIEPFRQKLKGEPNDPVANLVVGKYTCFVKNNWKVGLEYLAKGSEEGLKKVAQMELKTETAGKKRMEVGDAWWDLATEQEEEDDQILMKMRAGYHYKQAVASLSGLDKAKAEKRAAEAATFGDITFADSNKSKKTSDSDGSAGELGPVQLSTAVVEYDLAAAFDDVIVGGGGRYLIFHLSTLNKLAFFDVMQGKVTNYHSLESNNMRYAAGIDAFYVGYRPKNLLERWSLETFKKQGSVILPFENPLDCIACGAGSRGPVFVGASKAPGGFVDGKSLKPIVFQVLDHRYNRKDAQVFGAGPETRMRASFNGQTFTNWSTNVSPAGFRAIVLSGRQAHTFYEHDTVGYQMPSPDGQLIHTGKGVFTRQLKPFSGNNKLFAQSFSIPAVMGNYSVRVVRNDDAKDNAGATSAMTFHVNGNTDVLFRKDRIRLRSGKYGDFFSRELVALDKRVYFLPVCNLVVTLPISNKTVVMQQVDLSAELERNGADYLYVESRPITTVLSRKQYRYQIQAKSNGGNLKYEVETGPGGMKVSASGLVTWRAPISDSGKQHDIIISVKDSNDKTVSHSFKLMVE